LIEILCNHIQRALKADRELTERKAIVQLVAYL